MSINDNQAWNDGYGAGITCLGDATIILADGSNNTVKAINDSYPGIIVPVGKTLTIKGETGIVYGCGIGGVSRFPAVTSSSVVVNQPEDFA